MPRLPFRLRRVGLRKLRGTVEVEDGLLVLRIEDALFGLLDRDRVVVQIEPGAVEDLRVRRRRGKVRLVLTPRRSRLLDVIPGKHPDGLVLRLRRRDRDAAERLVGRFLALSDGA